MSRIDCGGIGRLRKDDANVEVDIDALKTFLETLKLCPKEKQHTDHMDSEFRVKREKEFFKGKLLLELKITFNKDDCDSNMRGVPCASLRYLKEWIDGGRKV